MDLIVKAPRKMVANVELPASKSLSARMIVLNALSGDSAHIGNLAQCDDTAALLHAVRHPETELIDVGPAGTAMRFLTALCSLRWRHVTLDGSERMRQRPIGGLVDSLRELGAHISYSGREGFPPLIIDGTPLHGGRLNIDGSVSSQFISALLMIAPVIGGLELHIAGQLVSRPYVEMTLACIRKWGIDAQWHGSVINVPAGCYVAPGLVRIEADWSAASYWWALQALLPDSSTTLKGLSPDSIQGDSRIGSIMRQMGVTGTWCGLDLQLHSDGGRDCCCSLFADLNGTPDLAPTVIVLLCLLERPFRITGLRTLRTKETDRLEALRTELAKLGYRITIEADDAVSWHFEHTVAMKQPHITTYHDHRMAMAFAMASVTRPGLVIEDAGVVSKSYPKFWEHLKQAGFEIDRA